MRYRKKPVVVEAFQLKDSHFVDTHMPGYGTPTWFKDSVGVVVTMNFSMNGNSCTIETLEGEMQASIDDWIIRGVKGELYPCKPDIFEATYEKAE